MKQIESIILYCLKQLNCERTVYSIFHLLNGKKSSQTIQDAHLFSLKNYFGIYEPLTREAFEEIIQSMVHQNQIAFYGDQRYHLTTLGKTLLENNPPTSYLDGWKYHSFTNIFWERLSLFVQVTSNLVNGEKRYIPIQKNKEHHQWLKSVLKEIKVQKKAVGEMVFAELVSCFDHYKGVDPSIFVFRLTGFKKIGLTPQQTARKMEMDLHDYHLAFIQILHYLIQKIRQEADQFSILPLLIRDLKQTDELTLSSRKTWNLLNQGYPLDHIANLRQLKMSTIEDHLVEFALHVNDFSIDTYVSKNLQEEILSIARKLETRQLKLIRDELNTATYFQIRLVLAKYGDKSWN
ncbi:helix-turn-helix domain-containing protein [Bacillus sp. 1P10SD]|uniref:helix-turn-helix domain-containing protein n=1 Tax=Bacillus sp. 1P10SD TaxID=3132265 RepID=UPI0039A4525C